MNEEPIVDEPVVTYTVREMFEQINKKLAEGFSSTAGRLDNLEGRVAGLENDRNNKRDRRASFHNLVLLLATVGMAVAGILSYLAVHG